MQLSKKLSFIYSLNEKKNGENGRVAEIIHFHNSRGR